MTAANRGFSLIEVLVTIVILMVGLLGLAALQTNATIAEMEAYQRSQALILAQDLADRISANKADASKYVQNDIGLSVVDCKDKVGYDLDVCEWGNQLAGAAEVRGGTVNVGAMIGARGCVTSPSANVYMVTVVWQGLSIVGTGPAVACGKDKYGNDGQRRAVSQIVRVALLAA